MFRNLIRPTSIICILLTLFAVSCGRSDDGCSADDILACQTAGERDAQKVVDAKSDSFERERAVIAIRARETSLRRAGFDNGADAYIDAASIVLRRNNIID